MKGSQPCITNMLLGLHIFACLEGFKQTGSVFSRQLRSKQMHAAAVSRQQMQVLVMRRRAHEGGGQH